jgi:hypothetical protein
MKEIAAIDSQPLN